MLTLSVQTFGQTPDVVPQTRETLPINPPSTNTVAAPPPSPIPPATKEKDAVLQATSDIAKATIEANKAMMDATATFYRERAEQDSRFFTYTTTLIGAFVIVLSGVLSFFGVKSLQSYEDKFSARLDNEVAKFTTIMEHAQAKAQKTLQAKMKNTDAMLSINLVISEPNLPAAQKEELYSRALACLEESLKISGEVDPATRAHTYAMRAYIKRRQDDYPAAVSNITEALNRIQDNATYYFNAACYNFVVKHRLFDRADVKL